MQKPKHIIKAQQFDRVFLENLFDSAEIIEKGVSDFSNVLSGKIMASLFYEPSTRTRFSFESAMHKLGGSVISTENAREFSSAIKGETLEDTIKVLNGYCDVIVLRHPEIGSAERAASVSDAPIINAGDGAGQHPTQALLDLYTIKKEIGDIDSIKIAMVGDLANGRTVRSLSYLLSKFNNIKIYFVAPNIVKMKDDIKEHLIGNKIEFYEETDLKNVAKEVDVIYQTRIQKERFTDLDDYEKTRGIYIITPEIMSLMKEKSIIMHPLPRVDEISKECDKDPRAAYFRQAQNGLYIRMALLKLLLT